MKKFTTVILVVLMVFAMSITAFAATGINENEQAVLDLLHTSKVMGKNGWEYSLPAEYVNSAENYFASDACDMTAAERDVILDCVKKGMDIIKAEADAQGFDGKEYDLGLMGQEAKTKVLDLGVKACLEVDLQLVYNAAENHVVITPVGGTTPVFDSKPVVKATGEEFKLTAGTVAIGVAALLCVGVAVMFVVSKKTGLLAK